MKMTFKARLQQFLYILKALIFTVVMIMGFWVIYALIWFGFGFTGANWAMWTLFFLAVLSEIGFTLWLER